MKFSIEKIKKLFDQSSASLESIELVNPSDENDYFLTFKFKGKEFTRTAILDKERFTGFVEYLNEKGFKNLYQASGSSELNAEYCLGRFLTYMKRNHHLIDEVVISKDDLHDMYNVSVIYPGSSFHGPREKLDSTRVEIIKALADSLSITITKRPKVLDNE